MTNADSVRDIAKANHGCFLCCPCGAMESVAGAAGCEGETKEILRFSQGTQDFSIVLVAGLVTSNTSKLKMDVVPTKSQASDPIRLAPNRKAP